MITLCAAQPRGDPEVLRADTVPLQLVDVQHDADANLLLAHVSGADNVALLNVFFGRDEDSLVKCNDVTLVDNQLVCKNMPNEAGERLLIVERRDAETDVVEARHRFTWQFSAPEVTALSGGENGTPLIVTGKHFGTPVEANLDAVEVFIGPFAAHHVTKPCRVVTSEQIVCAGGLPLGVGTQLPVRVCVGGVCGVDSDASLLYSYAQPVVESVKFIDGRVHFFGKGFGPEHEHADDTLTLEIDGRVCANAQVVVADREMVCDGDESGESIVLVRRSVRANVLAAPRRAVACGQGAITDVSPRQLPTDGQVELAIAVSEEFSASSIGEPVLLTIGGRRAQDCVIKSADTVVCQSAPAGSGAELDMLLFCPGAEETPATAFNAGRPSVRVSYEAPSIASVSCAATRGGKINVFGRNFGPSFVLPRVQLVQSDDESTVVECDVVRSTHERIQCKAPAGSGRGWEVRVVVDEQTSASAPLAYCAPSVSDSTRPHWQGGRVYLRGDNFGVDASRIRVFIDQEECEQVHIDTAHELVWCIAPPGEDESEHDVVVQVDGISSDEAADTTAAGELAKRGRHRRHRLKYHNHVPQFLGHSEQYTAVSCDTLKIKLWAHDEDGDYVYFRAGGLPEGASWQNGGDFMQINYEVPSGMLAWPRTELNVTFEAKVTDGPGMTSTSLSVNARACPHTKDTCKDLSCASRHEHCATCPQSGVVRCGLSAPVLTPSSGDCAPLSSIDANDVRVGADVMDTGYTIDTTTRQAVPLRAQGGGVAGVVIVEAGHVAPDGAQPCGSAVTCVDVSQCPADALAAAGKGVLHSGAVQIDSGSSLQHGVYVGLPLNDVDAAIGVSTGDGYGLCLGKWDCEAKKWTCVDEALTHRDAYLSGALDGAGCYAILADNCPDVANPDQTDSDQDGAGDVCQGEGDACEDCHSWQSTNVRYLQKFVVAAPSFDKVDDSARNQRPIVVVTETGDKYNVPEN